MDGVSGLSREKRHRRRTDVHSDTNCALGRATDVVTVPSDTHGDVGVNTSDGVSVEHGLPTAQVEQTHPQTAKKVPTY